MNIPPASLWIEAGGIIYELIKMPSRISRKDELSSH